MCASQLGHCETCKRAHSPTLVAQRHRRSGKLLVAALSKLSPHFERTCRSDQLLSYSLFGACSLLLWRTAVEENLALSSVLQRGARLSSPPASSGGPEPTSPPSSTEPCSRLPPVPLPRLTTCTLQLCLPKVRLSACQLTWSCSIRSSTSLARTRRASRRSGRSCASLSKMHSVHMCAMHTPSLPRTAGCRTCP